MVTTYSLFKDWYVRAGGVEADAPNTNNAILRAIAELDGVTDPASTDFKLLDQIAIARNIVDPGRTFNKLLEQIQEAFATQFQPVQNIDAVLSGSSAAWIIDVSFNLPSEGTPTGYTSQLSVNGGTFTTVTPDSTSGVDPLTYRFSYSDNAILRYRIRADYTEGSSAYRNTDPINAFINLNFDYSNNFHTIAA